MSRARTTSLMIFLKEINDLSKRTGSLTGDSVLLKIGQNIANIVTQASTDLRSARNILQSLSREHIVKVSGVLDASNSDLKINTMKTYCSSLTSN